TSPRCSPTRGTSTCSPTARCRAMTRVRRPWSSAGRWISWTGSASLRTTPGSRRRRGPPRFVYMSKTGEFQRDTKYLDGRITADGKDGWPVEPGRYRLVVARGCPWANRTMIVRRLLGLEDELSMGICGPVHDWRSWTFDLDPGEKDPVLGIHWLRE